MKLGNYAVPNDALKTRGKLQFESEDLSGQSSSSTRAHKGIKPKEFTVSLMIRTSEPDLLTELVSVAESIDDQGRLTVYEIVEPLVNAMKVKQVQFHGSVSAQEADSERSWSVSFTLIEYLSVAEKVEQREDAPVVEAQQTPGVETTAEETAIPENYTGFESVLKSLDTMLAPSNETP